MRHRKLLLTEVALATPSFFSYLPNITLSFLQVIALRSLVLLEA